MSSALTNSKMLPSIAMLSVLFGCGGGSDESIYARGIAATPVVLAGQIDQITESRGVFVWGDSYNLLCQQWSAAITDQSGWFYGSFYSTSTADVYVLPGPNDPLSVVAAENFPYTNGSVHAYVGDTVFFRGRNGFFGAWTINVIEGGSDGMLSGDWYFKAGGGGDFTRGVASGGSSTYDTGTGVCNRY